MKSTLKTLTTIIATLAASLICVASALAVEPSGYTTETSPSGQSIAADDSGNIYVGNTVSNPNFTNRLEKRNSVGAVLWTIGGGTTADGAFPHLNGVETDGTNVYVADGQNHRISVFDASDGSFVKTIGYGVSTGASALEVCTTACLAGISGTADGQLNNPFGVTVDSAGNIYAVEAYSSGGWQYRVEKYSSAGASLLTFALPTLPSDIAADSSDNLYVVFNGAQAVRSYTPAGSLISTIGVGGGSAAGSIAGGYGITVDDNDHVFVADQGGGRVSEFTSAGTFQRAFGWGVITSFAGKFESCTTASTCRSAQINSGLADGNMYGARDVAVASDGTIYASRNRGNPGAGSVLQRFNQDPFVGGSTSVPVTNATPGSIPVNYVTDVVGGGVTGVSCSYGASTATPCPAGTTVSVPFTSNGTYNATVNVTDSLGRTGVGTVKFTVSVAAPTNSKLPSFKGTLKVGKKLAASPGTWSGTNVTHNYQWYRCNYKTTSCSTIAGATARTFTIPSSLGNRRVKSKVRIKVRVTGVNSGGSLVKDSAISKKRIACKRRCR